MIRNSIIHPEGTRIHRNSWVRLEEVILLESEGNYTRVTFEKERSLVHRSLKRLDDRLDPRLFFRANRKHILNLMKVSRMEEAGQARLVVILEDGREIELSRRRAQQFRELMSL